MLKVVGDILLALDSGNLALLSLLDLSAAFDTVDYDGVVIKWFAFGAAALRMDCSLSSR